ncbi:MAG: transketolase [Alphaproteobacteria bacterium]|nr:transketolase [Alphaproteobacteria bacterium]
MAERGEGPRLKLVGEERRPAAALPADELACLEVLERKALWLAAWTVHNANHLRPSRDGLKVGGHQASSASAAAILTALYFGVLRPGDRIAVKPHASPLLHAIAYLAGRQERAKLEAFRALGGAQSYPSRTKDTGGVDFSTGSVGLGVAATLFASLAQDLLSLKRLLQGGRQGRMVALMGDAELDEGNVFEALLEGWKHDVRNLWWVIDYNRQSLDGVVSDQLFQKIQSFFSTVGWKVVTLKYGKRQQAAFREPGGEALRRWIDQCPNDLYSALTFKGGQAWRRQLAQDIGAEPGIEALLARHDDEALHRLMTNLAGHDMASLVEAFRAAEGDDTPHCFVAYTIKGQGLPLAGHKDNHAGLMTPEQMEALRQRHRIPQGAEWERFAGLDLPAERLEDFIRRTPYFATMRETHAPAPPLAMPDVAAEALGDATRMSTQEAFGRIMHALGRRQDDFAGRLVTFSPDVTVSTSLGGWVNQRGIFHRSQRGDTFRAQAVPSAQKWAQSPEGQHVELGIAENNLFLALAAFGLAEPLFGQRLLPVGTLYDPFIARGLDALNYACYQDARFMLVATPSGITLAPEGGAHQSINTPLIGMSQPGLAAFEPAHGDELAALMAWGFAHMQERAGGSVYFRLSTRQIAQPRRELGPAEKAAMVAGGYWLRPPQAGAELAIVAMGAVVPEALAAHAELEEEVPGLGLLLVTAPGRLHQDWLASQAEGRPSHAGRLLGELAPDAALVSVLDGHPATLSWLGAVHGQPIRALGVARFGQSGDIPDLYRTYGIDAEAIIDAAAQALLARLRRR